MKRRSEESPGSKWIELVSLLILLGILLSCSQGEEPVQVDFSKKKEVTFKEDSDVITYGYLPQYSHGVSYQRHQPLIEYLRVDTGLPVKQVFADTFDEYIKMVGQGKIDICFTNPFAYVRIARRYDAKAFARVVEVGGKVNFRGQIICRKDNPFIQSIEDCKGKRWIAVDASSAGGYLWALGLFRDYGIGKEDFAELGFAPGPGGKQEKVVLAVHAGRYDIGSIREGTLDVVADKVDVSEIRVIAYTPWYPGWMYAVRKGLEPRIVEMIKASLLKLDCSDPKQRPVCEAARFEGIVSATDADFEPVRELAEKVGIDLNE